MSQRCAVGFLLLVTAIGLLLVSINRAHPEQKDPKPSSANEKELREFIKTMKESGRVPASFIEDASKALLGSCGEFGGGGVISAWFQGSPTDFGS